MTIARQTRRTIFPTIGLYFALRSRPTTCGKFPDHASTIRSLGLSRVVRFSFGDNRRLASAMLRMRSGQLDDVDKHWYYHRTALATAMATDKTAAKTDIRSSHRDFFGPTKGGYPGEVEHDHHRPTSSRAAPHDARGGAPV